MPEVDARTVLVITVALLTVYTVGIGGSTAAAIGAWDAWRRRARGAQNLDPRRGEVVLVAPTLPRAIGWLRTAGWIAFPPALVLALFVDLNYPWLAPVTVLLMVGLNAYYFTAMQGIGEDLTLTTEGFRVGSARTKGIVRWAHVTDFMGAHIGPFRGIRMSEGGEWQDPKTVPNVIFYRLNRALVRPRKSPLSRFTGMTYFDGVIRNRFGVTTQELMLAMRTCHRLALEEEALKLRRPRQSQPLTNSDA
jgi:acyl dehydratase